MKLRIRLKFDTTLSDVYRYLFQCCFFILKMSFYGDECIAFFFSPRFDNSFYGCILWQKVRVLSYFIENFPDLIQIWISRFEIFFHSFVEVIFSKEVIRHSDNKIGWNKVRISFRLPTQLILIIFTMASKYIRVYLHFLRVNWLE